MLIQGVVFEITYVTITSCVLFCFLFLSSTSSSVYGSPSPNLVLCNTCTVLYYLPNSA
jgi:hypothetical protein